jgi:hypothetical protein
MGQQMWGVFINFIELTKDVVSTVSSIKNLQHVKRDNAWAAVGPYLEARSLFILCGQPAKISAV